MVTVARYSAPETSSPAQSYLPTTLGALSSLAAGLSSAASGGAAASTPAASSRGGRRDMAKSFQRRARTSQGRRRFDRQTRRTRTVRSGSETENRTPSGGSK